MPVTNNTIVMREASTPVFPKIWRSLADMLRAGALPYDEVKHEHVDGDVNNVLRAKQGTYDRNAHKTAVRKQCQQFVDWGRLTRWPEDKYDKKSGEEKKQVKNADKNQIFPK